MNRTIAILALAVSFLVVPFLRAEEFPHLEFVRGLRAEGLPDLALDYLTVLSKKKDLPKDVVTILPIELAKTLIELAATETNASRRSTLYERSQAQLQKFIKDNESLPQASEARLDLARIVSLQAGAQLNKAQQEEDKNKAAALKSARAPLESAAVDLQKAVDAIKTQLAQNKDPKLEQDKLDAELELAVNLFFQMLTYDSAKEPLDRARLGDKAIDELKRIGGISDKNPTCWLAFAWLMRCYDERDQFGDIVSLYERFGRSSALEPGKRLARYHYMLVVPRKPATDKKSLPPLVELVQVGKDWLRDYKSFSNTPEGCGVRFQLAQALETQAQGTKDQKAAADLCDQALKLYDDLQTEENEYSIRAGDNKVKLMLKQKPELSKGNAGKLETFKDCYLRAQLEVARMGEEAKKPPADRAKAVEQRKQHFQNIVDSVTRGLELADDKAAATDLIEARYLLIYALLVLAKPYEAAIVGEDLARSYPHSPRAAPAGGYALHAYAQVLDEEEKSHASEKSLEADRNRLRRLAEYLQKTWPNDTVADGARHQLGLLAYRQKNYPEVVAVLSKITPQYTLYIQSQFQLGSAASQAHKEKLDPPQGQKPWQEQAIAAFQKIPEPAGNDIDGTRFYFYAKMELAKSLFAAKKFDDMETLTNQLVDKLATVKNAPLREEIDPILKAMPLYAKYGKADNLFRSDQSDRFAKVRALIDPVVNDLLQKKLTLTDPTLLRGILGLALRSSVFDDQMSRAKEILKLLQDSAGDFENQNAILVDLVQQLKSQIDELTKKGQKAELDKTVSKFSKFLDELAKQPLKDMKPENVRFLAYSYSGLGKHKEAAAMLAKISEPPKEAKEEERKFYNIVRVMYAREARLGGDHPTASKVIQEVMNTDFGKRSLDAKKEEIFLLEDKKKYGAAANAWNRMLGDLKKIRESNPQAGEMYNDCLYRYISCMYKFAMGTDNDAKKRDYIKRAAQLIVNLRSADEKMGGMKERYDELLQKEPLLKAQVDELVKELKK